MRTSQARKFSLRRKTLTQKKLAGCIEMASASIEIAVVALEANSYCCMMIVYDIQLLPMVAREMFNPLNLVPDPEALKYV